MKDTDLAIREGGVKCVILSAVTLAYLPHARWTALVDNRWRTSVGINLEDGACLLLIRGKLTTL